MAINFRRKLNAGQSNNDKYQELKSQLARTHTVTIHTFVDTSLAKCLHCFVIIALLRALLIPPLLLVFRCKRTYCETMRKHTRWKRQKKNVQRNDRRTCVNMFYNIKSFNEKCIREEKFRSYGIIDHLFYTWTCKIPWIWRIIDFILPSVRRMYKETVIVLDLSSIHTRRYIQTSTRTFIWENVWFQFPFDDWTIQK